VKKVVKNRRFLVIFSTKTRYSSLVSLNRGTKVGLKMNNNCYILQTQVLKKIIGSRYGDIRVRASNIMKILQKSLIISGFAISKIMSS
jgi:hypothetical protein